MIKKDMSMGRVLLDYNQLLPLMSRFNIRLGVGEKNVEEVCNQHEVNPDFFLEIANAYLNEGKLSEEVDLSAFPLSDMVKYLRSTHDYYLDIALPRMEKRIGKLLAQSELSDKEIKLLSGFFNDYREDFMAHISLEETEILPYILELEEQSLKKKADKSFLESLKDYSITAFAQEHDRLEFSLENLGKLIIKYLPPFKNQELCIRVLLDLSELVRDLSDHGEMEDRVLIPRVEALEKTLLAQQEEA